MPVVSLSSANHADALGYTICSSSKHVHDESIKLCHVLLVLFLLLLALVVRVCQKVGVVQIALNGFRVPIIFAQVQGSLGPKSPTYFPSAFHSMSGTTNLLPHSLQIL